MPRRRAQHPVPPADLPPAWRPVPAPPFTTGGVLSATLSLTCRNAVPLLAIVALTQGPFALLHAIGIVGSYEDPSDLRLSGLYAMVFGILQSGAIVWLVDGAQRGERRDVFTALRLAGRRYLSLLGASLQAGIIAGLYFLLLIVPGIRKVLSFAVVLPVVMLEDKRASAALARSTQLMDGHRMTALLPMVVLALPSLCAEVGPLFAPSLQAGPLGAALGFLGAILTIPLEVLGVVLYAAGRRSHAELRQEVFGD